MSTPQKVLDLIKVFARNLEDYQTEGFKEENLCNQFINPLFKCLGWDMENEQGNAPRYTEVIYQPSLKMGDETKAPDYCFRIGETPKFYLEAKKPAVNIVDDPGPAFQLRRYAWTAKMPLSILTNFRDFAVYDGRIRPVHTDKASNARVLSLRYTDYAKDWDKIADVFARDAILKGSFDKYADTSKGKKGTAPVDAAFLQEIESWREELAKNLALRNPELASRDLNFAVQITIDRIIFLRMCEDRGIERYGQLKDLQDQDEVYGHLLGLFRKADERYNSGLFHFDKEKDRAETPDELTPHLTIDDKVLKAIFKGLYYPYSSYAFAVLPVEILGQVYEQFLGKVIRLTAGHQARVEEKPEVKKAGGVYYTPAYIVNYIVKHTVGKLLGEPQASAPGEPSKLLGEPQASAPGAQTKFLGEPQASAPGEPVAPANPPVANAHGSPVLTPKQAAKLRILDPACGSGSFLLGAYQYLLKWHLDQYVADGPDKHKKELFQSANGDWRLTTGERKRILLNNIYGVDIDPQAVEVTKLSLLLKVLEGESQETISQQMTLYHERALPDLASNIQCGNSLIGPDFYEGQQLALFDEEEQYRINVFDWNAAFPAIMKAGGFDAVIGNPPYIGFHGFAELKDYLRTHYLSAHGKFDIYLPFIEWSLRLLREQGTLGFICPTNFMKRSHGHELRSHLRETIRIVEITDFQDVQIFKGATNYTGVFLFEKSLPDAEHLIRYKTRELTNGCFKIYQSALTADPWIFRDGEIDAVVNKIRKACASVLGNLTTGISEGIVTGQNDVFLLSRSQADAIKLEWELLRPCVRGRQIRRYFLEDVDEVVIYPYRLVGKRTVALSETDLRGFPRVWDYLEKRRADLGGRGYFESSSKKWYELWCQRDFQLLATAKILVPELAESNRFALADGTHFYGDTVCGIVLSPDIPEHMNYYLGLLNSRLLEFFYKATTVPKANAFFIYKTMFLKNMPIRRIDFDNPLDKARHDRIVEQVDHMLAIQKALLASRTPHDRAVLQGHASAVNKQIDELVYELYGIGESDVAAMQDANAAQGCAI